MADILEATEDRITRKVGSTDRTFLILDTYDRADLLRDDLKHRQEAHAARKQKKIDNMKLAGITGDQMYVELDAHDDKYPESADEQNWIDFVNDTINEPAILARSLRKTYGNDADAIAHDVRMTLEDKAKLCGLTVRTRTSGGPPENPGPNPPAPAVYQTPAEPTTSTGPSPVASYSTGSE